MLCDVHKTSAVHEKTFAMVGEDVSGMIRTALALRNGAAIQRFRRCLADEIGSRLEIREGYASQEATIYKRQVLATFVPHGSKKLMRRILLALLPNGDWRASQVQFYVDDCTPVALRDRATALKFMTDGLMIALTSTQPACYPRHRWTGAVLATDDLGVFESCHRLLSSIFVRFCASHASGALRAQLLGLLHSAAEYDPLAPMALEQGDAGDDDAPGATDEQQPIDGGPNKTAPPEGDWKSGETEYAKLNAQDRRKGLAYCLSKPLGHLLIQRIVMEPLRVYMSSQLARAGEAWENAERANVAKAVLAGLPPTRAYRVTEVASGVDDNQFFQAVATLYNSDDWNVLPPSRVTVECRALVFRMVARMACAVEELLASRHRRCPFLTFRLLCDWEGTLGKLKPCMLDTWSKRILGDINTLEERKDELLALLALVAELVTVDISQVEARHASLRRILYGQSLQTHRLTFPSLSAQWLCTQIRRRGCGYAFAAPKSAKAKTQARSARRRSTSGMRKRHGAAQPSQKRGFGGAFRGWLRLHADGARPTGEASRMQGAAYRRAKRDATGEYKEAVRLGTAMREAARARGHVRSALESNVRRQRVLHGLRGELLQLQAQTDLVGPMAFARAGLRRGANIAETLSCARVANRLAAARKRSVGNEGQDMLLRYQQGPGAVALNQCLQAYPFLQAFRPTILPSVHGVSLQMDLVSEEDVSLAMGRAADLHMLPSLEGAWFARHTMLAHDDCPPVAGDRDAVVPAESDCLLAGICLCDDAGQLFRRKADRFNNVLKSVFAPLSGIRSQLTDGLIIARLQGERTDYEANLAEAEGCNVDVWLHVGMHYLSPFRPTWHVVQPVEDVGEVPQNRKRIYIKTTLTFQKFYVGLDPIRHCDIVSVQFFRIEKACREIPTFRPHTVPVTIIAGFEEPMRWWPRRVAKRRRKSEDEAKDEEGEQEEDHAADGAQEPIEGNDVDDDLRPMDFSLVDALMETYNMPLSMPQQSQVASDEIGEPPSGMPSSSRGPAGPILAAQRREHERQQGVRAAGPYAFVRLESGTISFYQNKGYYEARCLFHAEEHCTLSRQATSVVEPIESSNTRSGEYCVGLLAAWLNAGDVCDKASHKDKKLLKLLAGEQRAEARAQALARVLALDGGPALVNAAREVGRA